ncbi:hypothetical protein [Demequina litorisediminis]|uniref:hypothetical protein n=1 Tax=Demequina litorisediminis TaxID=1849022 RepID=UPI0024E11402|nr:hypothetical protein [Demequina litorisediminis]
MTGSSSLVWDPLLAETQARDRTHHHRAAPPRASTHEGGHLDRERFGRQSPLNLGLHTFTSGFERLGKVAILLDGRLRDGEFRPVRGYNHGVAQAAQPSATSPLATATSGRPLTPAPFTATPSSS